MTEGAGAGQAEEAGSSGTGQGTEGQGRLDPSSKGWGALKRQLLQPAWLLVPGVLWICAGVLPHLRTRLLGHPFGELIDHLWQNWLIVRGFTRHPAMPWRHEDVILGTPMAIFPTDILARLFSLSLQPLVGRVAASNLLTFSLLLLAAFMVYRLARDVGATPWPAVLGSLILTWHPALLGFVSDGRQDSLGVGLAAWAILEWRRLVQTPSRGPAVRLGLAAGLLVAESFNYAWLLAWGLGAMSAWCLARALWPAGRAWGQLWTTGRLWLLSAGLALALSLPVVISFLQVEQASGGRMAMRFPQSAPLVERINRQGAPAPLIMPLQQWDAVAGLDRGPAVGSLLEPLPEHWQVLPPASFPHDRLAPPLVSPGGRRFLGGVELSLAILALALGRWKVLPWVAGAGLLQLLAFGHGAPNGPPVHIPLLEGEFILRSAPLLSGLPMGNHFGSFGLLAVFSRLLLGVGVALGLTLGRLPGWVLGLAIGLWGLELQLLGPTPMPVRVTQVSLPRVSLELAQSPAPGGVLVINRRGEVDYLLQLWHGRPIVTSPTGPLKAQSSLAVTEGLIRDLTGSSLMPGTGVVMRSPPGPRMPAANLQDALKKQGIGWVLFFPALVYPTARAELSERLETLLGPAERQADGTWVWRL